MKKPIAKLVVRRDTVRELASMELTRAVGGDENLVWDTGLKMCTGAINQPLVPPAG